MGLDAVELIIRTEEFFAITIADDEAQHVRTVGDLYSLICTKLNLTSLAHPATPSELPVIKKLGWIHRNYKHLPPPPELLPWRPETVWSAMVAIFVDQLSLKPNEVLPNARIADDLGIC